MRRPSSRRSRQRPSSTARSRTTNGRSPLPVDRSRKRDAWKRRARPYLPRSSPTGWPPSGSG
eukprot:13508650-Alexandrium_andersonii.AAC.1